MNYKSLILILTVAMPGSSAFAMRVNKLSKQALKTETKYLAKVLSVGLGAYVGFDHYVEYKKTNLLNDDEVLQAESNARMEHFENELARISPEFTEKRKLVKHYAAIVEKADAE